MSAVMKTKKHRLPFFFTPGSGQPISATSNGAAAISGHCAALRLKGNPARGHSSRSRSLEFARHRNERRKRGATYEVFI